MKRPGFTLAETTIGLALLAVSVLALLAVGLSAMRANSKAASTQSATQVLNREMDRLIYDVHNDLSISTSFWAPVTTSAFREATIDVGHDRFSWAIYAQDVPALVDSDNRLRKLNGVISWFDGQRVGYGQLTVRATALVNESAPNP